MDWLADRHLSNYIPESLLTQLTETYQALLMENVSPVTALKELEDELQDISFQYREILLNGVINSHQPSSSGRCY